MSKSVGECAEQIAKKSKTMTTEEVVEILQPFVDELSSAMIPLLATLNRMKKEKSAWSFSLPGDVVAHVNFSVEPERRHIEAFQKVFLAMASAWLETEA